MGSALGQIKFQAVLWYTSTICTCKKKKKEKTCTCQSKLIQGFMKH